MELWVSSVRQSFVDSQVDHISECLSSEKLFILRKVRWRKQWLLNSVILPSKFDNRRKRTLYCRNCLDTTRTTILGQKGRYSFDQIHLSEYPCQYFCQVHFFGGCNCLIRIYDAIVWCISKMIFINNLMNWCLKINSFFKSMNQLTECFWNGISVVLKITRSHTCL